MATIILRTMNYPSHNWSYPTATKYLLSKEIGYTERTWKYLQGQQITKAAKQLMHEFGFPIEGHIVLKLLGKTGHITIGKMDHIPIREAKVLNFDGKTTFEIALGDFLYMEPSRYRLIAERLPDGWLGHGKMNRQLVHAANQAYEVAFQREVIRGPAAREKALRSV